MKKLFENWNKYLNEEEAEAELFLRENFDSQTGLPNTPKGKEMCLQKPECKKRMEEAGMLDSPQQAQQQGNMAASEMTPEKLKLALGREISQDEARLLNWVQANLSAFGHAKGLLGGRGGNVVEQYKDHFDAWLRTVIQFAPSAPVKGLAHRVHNAHRGDGQTIQQADAQAAAKAARGHFGESLHGDIEIKRN
jgi:hypothetical protein